MAKDTRERVPEDKPNPSVVRILNTDTENSEKPIWGSGIIIREDKILTSAHVIKPMLENPDSWVVIAGEHGKYGYKRIGVKELDYNKRYDMNIEPELAADYDIGVITVKEDFPASFITNVQIFYSYPEAPLETSFSWTGYPSDKIKAKDPAYQWIDTRRPVSISSNHVNFDVIAAGGQSGSGLINPADNVVGLLSSISSIDGLIKFTIIDRVNFEYIKREFNGRKIDFQEDKKAAEDWGKEKEKEWGLTYQQKEKINDFLDNKNNIKTNYKEITFSSVESFQDEIKDLKIIDIALYNRVYIETIVTYKNVRASDIGFNKPLTTGHVIKDDDLKKFIEQFLNRDIKFDSYLETHLTKQDFNAEERIILKITVSDGKKSIFVTGEGVVLNNKEYKMLIGKDYVLHADNITKRTVKGVEYVQVEGTLKHSLDFKNDMHKAITNWGSKNYRSWLNRLTDSQRKALEDSARQDHIEINKYLREQGEGENEKLDEQIKNISESLKIKPIPENITVYRWCNMDEFGYPVDTELPSLQDFEEQCLNIIKEDKGYLSTSLSSEQLEVFELRKIILRLQIPKGSIGAYISVMEEFASEKEILLDKGSKYQIDKITEVIIKGEKRYVVDGTFKPDGEYQIKSSVD
ncbi:ADP-ribosyltransferase [Bacillus mycoides]|uniref:ADP-ribosyltransferase n=1 Tax=Bacillus mycoides TaxID=1405 RepID=UPI003D65B47E